MVNVLTSDRGKLSFKARGVRTNRSRMKAACQLLCYCEFTLFEKEGYLTLKEASVIESFFALRNDLESLALASYFAQAAEVVSQEDLPNPALLSLVLNCLHMLCTHGASAKRIQSVFELRLSCLAGYVPELNGCRVCGRADADRFLVSEGALQCSGCGQSGGLRMPLSAASLAAMRYICSCDAKRLFSFTLSDPAEKELSDLTEVYLAAQLERGFSALDYYKSIQLL